MIQMRKKLTFMKRKFVGQANNWKQVLQIQTKKTIPIKNRALTAYKCLIHLILLYA